MTLCAFSWEARKPSARSASLAQHEPDQWMTNRAARDRHAEIGRVGEVDRCLAPGYALLLEEHILLRPVQRAPVSDATLQCAARRPAGGRLYLRGVSSRYRKKMSVVRTS